MPPLAYACSGLVDPVDVHRAEHSLTDLAPRSFDEIRVWHKPNNEIMSARKKQAFVTVGTTLFEALVDACLSEACLDWLTENGFTHLVIQFGKGRKPDIPSSTRIQIDCYAFQPSLAADMEASDLILCHAGAGTLMEALSLHKTIVTVINTALMDNHQTELAYALAKKGHLYVVDRPEDLDEAWSNVQKFRPVRYDGGDPHDFPRLLDSFFGGSERKSR